MKNSSIVKSLFFAIIATLGLISCDKDFNNLDTGIVEDDMHFGMDRMDVNVVAYDKFIGPVQSNNLTQNSLGIYTVPGFGKKTANYVTQAELSDPDPLLGVNPVIDSVYVYIPYYTTVKEPDGTTGNSKYNDIEPFYGTRTATMNLRIFENGYYLRSTDPVTAEPQVYYSDNTDIPGNTASSQLNNGDAWQNSAFTFNNDEIRFSHNGTVKERLAPGLFAMLDKSYFQQKFFDVTNRAKLVNNNLFREYFRGLYFKVEQNGNNEAMTLLKTSDAKIVIKYTDGKLKLDGTIDETPASRVKKTITINLKGNTVNLFDVQRSAEFDSALTSSNENTGDNKLYILGGAGSMGVIKIDDASLAGIKKDQNAPPKVLVNEANLSFYLDDSYINSTTGLPLRVYLYDLDNKRPLYDYYVDLTTNSANQKYNKYVFGGLHQEIKDAQGEVEKRRYKLKITNHINNIINKDSTNVTLGLVITDNINLIDNAAIKNTFTTSGKDVKFTPASNVIAVPGVILYGNNAAENRKLKLEIFYTKPD